MKKDGTVCEYSLDILSSVSLDELIDRGKRFIFVQPDDNKEDASGSAEEG